MYLDIYSTYVLDSYVLDSYVLDWYVLDSYVLDWQGNNSVYEINLKIKQSNMFYIKV